jgi:hypothetical protein
MSVMQIKIKTQGSARIIECLQGLKEAAPELLSRAINKTLADVRTVIISEVGAVITADEALITDACEITEATAQQLTGQVDVSGKSLPLNAFTNRPTPEGIEVLVKKGRAPKVIRGSFYAATRDGTGIYWRQWHGDTSRRARRNLAYGRLPEMYRLPIKQLFSSSVANIASDEPTLTQILDKAEEQLQKNMKDECDDVFSKL